MVHDATRLDNTLDLVITNSPGLILRVELVPGLSGHSIFYFEVSTKKVLKNIHTRRVPLYSRADWDEERHARI